jgi:hypothetical protein
MKKLIIGALIGGILIFLWQMLSWTVLDLHGKEYQKASNQDEVMPFLSSHFTHDGQYYLPSLDRNATSAEHKKFVEDMKGKPWAILTYHASYEIDMLKNILMGLAAAILAAAFACWILMKNTNSSFATTFISCVLIGLAGYLFIPFANKVWFQTPGLKTNVIDTLLSWGLCGIWLGWWLNRKKA